ncbi:hypothetical protein PPSIR1_02556 [Plesiocystis pacifica SIR-1]|uniref:DUF839 domain-containing protein n=1 Tax=Plesiocystis pacifica SIR-1 TaxID=391625 RepID=A6G475_9BACT|nr:hypothetical protein PPSIR1_02556 [Plesiocystis pacifica SIR-1]
MITSGAASLAAALATLASNRRAAARGRWGDLVSDPNGILDLPEGFSYAIIEEAGEDMDDGYRVPGRPDGMACFEGPDDTLILMRNHENSVGDILNGPYKLGQLPPDEAYEAAAMGGVTRLVIDAGTYERISSNLVLVGTVRNCAGGPSPWGWLSCEENVDINGGVRHGYTFVCPTDADSVQDPQPVEGYGRYNHEAVAVDPSNFHAYLSEDRGDSCLYRFVPDDMSDPFTGQLQALRVVGQDNFATTNMDPGDVVDVDWVDIDEPDPDSDSVRDEAQDKGAAIIVRGEGMWFFEGQVYICSTSGGPAGAGQIFRLIDGDSPTLECVVSSTSTSVLDKPDNITVAPWGEVFMAEDGGGDQYIRWINDQGEVCDFARNATSDSEFAGVCFSPDGQALFVNIQGDGLTLVVTGPFPEMMGGEEEETDTGEETDTEESTDTGETEDTGETDTTDGSTEESGSSGDESGTDGSSGEDEIGDDTEGTGGGADGGSLDEEGCACSTDEGGSSGVAAAAVVAAVGVRSLLDLDD